MSHHSRISNNFRYRRRPDHEPGHRSEKRLSTRRENHNPIVLHLFDDATPALGKRIISYFLNSAPMHEVATHRAAQLTRNPWSVDPQGADIIVSHLTIGWRNLPFRRRLRNENSDRTLIQVEHVHSEGFAAQNVTNQNRFDAMLRGGYELVDHVVTLSEAQRNWILERKLAAPSCVNTIPSAVALEPFVTLPAPLDAGRNFGLIGPLNQRTGFEIAIRAFLGTPGADLRLHIFGDGPQRPRLMALAAKDSRIVFHQQIDDPSVALDRIDVLLTPSRWAPFCHIACCALAAQRPVLAAPVDGLCDLVEYGVTLVRDQSLQAWSETIAAAANGIAPLAKPTSSILTLGKSFEQGWNQMIQSNSAQAHHLA